MVRVLLAFCAIAPLCVAAGPFSLLTLVEEQGAIGRPTDAVSGPVASVAESYFRINTLPSGERKEVPLHSRLWKYDAEKRVVESVDRESSEKRQTMEYENGRIRVMRSRTYSPAGKPLDEEFVQTNTHDSAGRVVEVRRERGGKLENHLRMAYDERGRMVREEVRQGPKDDLVFTTRLEYSGDGEPVVKRSTVLPSGEVKPAGSHRMDAAGRIVEMWGAAGFHTRFGYDAQGRVVEQVTDAYKLPAGCDDCPLPGAIRTRYRDAEREQTFLDVAGVAVLMRLTRYERDGSIVSIQYQQLSPEGPARLPDLFRVVAATTLSIIGPWAETDWDELGNWTERRVMVRPPMGPPVAQFLYRRAVVYKRDIVITTGAIEKQSQPKK